MLRLLPYLAFFVLGFFAGMVVVIRNSTAKKVAEQWERKCKDAEQRYRDLTERLSDIDRTSETEVNRWRTALWNVQGILKRQDASFTEQASAALEEIDTALKEE